MERQNERIQNVLRIRTMEVQTAEKKYRDLMTKQSKAQADRARSGRTMTLHDVKEKLCTDLEMRKWAKFSQHQTESIKKERAELQAKKTSADTEKVRIFGFLGFQMWKLAKPFEWFKVTIFWYNTIQKRRYYDRLLTQKSAELSQLQRTAQEVDMQPNPCAAKYLPLKESFNFPHRNVAPEIFRTFADSPGRILNLTTGSDRTLLADSELVLENSLWRHKAEIFKFQCRNFRMKRGKSLY